MSDYQCRFISHEQGLEAVNLYHLARTALAPINPTPLARMIWAARELHKKYPDISETGAYKDLCGLLGR